MLTQLPEFNPNPRCRFHDPDQAATTRWYSRCGSFYTQARGSIPRFRCRACGGLRQMGRFQGVTYRVIQNRVRRLARNALALMDRSLAELEFSENLTMDGFESFTRSRRGTLTGITAKRRG
jgi:hypothetical protein